MIENFDTERFGTVTASRCTPLVPKRDAKTGMISLAKKLANEKFFRFYDEVNTWQTEHGNLGESYAFDYYKNYFDETIEKGKFHKGVNFGGTTDAESIVNKYGVDFKCPCSLETFTSYLFDGITTEQYNQCQLYMRLTGFDTWKIAVFLIETTRMSDDGIVYPVPPDKRMIVIDIKADKEWNEKFDSNLPEVIRMRDEFLEILKKQFDKNIPKI